MIADEGRSGPHLRSIADTVRPGDVVVELGTGYGHMAVAACKAGARHVYAIEPDGDAVAMAAEIVAANGCADRVTLIPEHSTRAQVAERGDVLIEDLRGVMPFFGDRVQSLVDARTRLLKPGARPIAVRDRFWAAPCEMPVEFARMCASRDGVLRDIDSAPVLRRLREDWCKVRVVPSQLLAEPVEVLALDLSTIVDPDAHGSAQWKVTRPGRAEGVVTWFDTEFSGGHIMTNAPVARGNPQTPAWVYGQAFFPLTRGIDVVAADQLSLEFHAKYAPTNYVLAWTTTHRSRGKTGPVTTFRQSNLGAALGMFGSAGMISRRLAGHRPASGPSTAVLRDLLALADGARSYTEIADALTQMHPGRFRDRDEALIFATAQIAPLEDEDFSGLASHS